ncbi:MAG: putative repeat protein (TIGR01451 family) [Patiriisocius sp.]|jgi:uncharacterized repeat protein (TIGR01451 family)
MTRLLFLCACLCFSFTSFSQIVNIPDANFKNTLVNYNSYVIDTNGDGEIQVIEAEALANVQLNLGDENISDLTGLEAFINLRNLYSYGNLYTDIEISALAALDFLYLSERQLTSITFPTTNNLEEIYISSDFITTLDLSQFNNLEDFSFTGNFETPLLQSIELPATPTLRKIRITESLLTEIDVSGNDNIEYLQIRSGNLNNINVSNLLNLEYLVLTNNNLSSIDVSQNNALKTFGISINNITNVDISNLIALEIFYFNRCEVAAIDVSNNINLELLILFETNLTDIDLSNNGNLELIRLDSSQISTLDLSNNPNLINLNISNTLIDTIDLSNNDLIEDLRINYLDMNMIDLSNLTVLDYLECLYSTFTEIDFSNNTLLERAILVGSQFESLDFSSNPNIRFIPTNGSLNLESINVKNTTLSELYIQANNNPNLNFICVDDINEAAAQNWQIPPFTSFVTDCSLADGELNRIEGTVNYDANGNNCGVGAYGIDGYLVNATDGTSNFANTTVANGGYGITVSENTYTTQVLGLSPYFDTNPATATNTFVGFDQTQTANFCVVPNTTANDLTVAMFPVSEARPGFEAFYEIVYENVGTTTLTGEVTLAFSDPQIDFVESTPSPTNQTSSTLTFNVGTLAPFQQGSVMATFLLDQPPINESGYLLAFTATINPTAGDATPDDNEFYFPQEIVNSFDPNDKRCIQGSQVLIEDADQYLHYIVRFQNLGTASAINVRVVDVLDDLLDFSTFRVLTASHAMETTLIDGQINFIFDNINLPAEINDPEGSNGYITFKIKPRSGIVLGDEVNNRADIYFDFNPPILTNVTSTTYVYVLYVSDSVISDVVLYPNPATTEINIQTAYAINEVSIVNTLGQQLQIAKISEDKKHVDVSALATGMYFVKVTTEQGTGICQVVKQ